MLNIFDRAGRQRRQVLRVAGLRPKREDVVLLAFVFALLLGVTNAIELAGGPRADIDRYLPNVRFYLLALVGFVCGAVTLLLIRHRPDKPTAFLVHGPPARELWASIVAGLPLLLAAGFFMPSLALIKSGIPLFAPYVWDAEFIALDRTIHGTDPWRLLQPILGYPLVTAALAQLYHTWFLLIYAGALFFAFLVKDRTLRYRYFLSYFLLWTIGGMAIAVGFASVGPCFLEPLLGDAHFAEQMAYLEAADRRYSVPVLDVQRELIEWFRAGDYGLGRGISAMPSMHVGLAFLFFLAMRHVSRAAGWFFGTFCFLIAIASVHLAYHYAVDGYASIALVSTIWVASGKIAPLLLTPPRDPAASMEAPPVFRSASDPAPASGHG
jgi:hypothetical protein